MSNRKRLGESKTGVDDFWLGRDDDMGELPPACSGLILPREGGHADKRRFRSQEAPNRRKQDFADAPDRKWLAAGLSKIGGQLTLALGVRRDGNGTATTF